MCIRGAIKYFIIIAILPIEIRMSGAEDLQKTSCEGDKNWAVVPYTLTQNMIFPSFNEKIRKFNFKNIEDEIKISQNWDEKGVAAVVWEAAIELTNFISENINVKGKRVIELGAGTGLVGIACAKLGADVTVTDLNQALPFLSKNVEENFDDESPFTPKIQELKWGENLHQYRPKDYDIIIGADVVYIEDTFDDLMDTIRYLAGCKGHSSTSHHNGEIRNDTKPTVFLSAKMRYNREAKFINRMKKYFNVKMVSATETSNVNIYAANPL